MSVALIGAGAWGRNILRNLAALGELHSVTDPDSGALERAAKEAPSVKTFGDIREALSSDCDMVAIATPAPSHSELASMALSAGKHTFVEKPLALSVRDAERLEAMARERGLTLMVGHLMLFHPGVRRISEAINEGRIGRVLSIHQQRLNHGRARSVENALWSLGVHDVAVACNLAGAGVAAAKCIGQAALQRGVEDDTYLHLEFKNGVKAHIHNSWLWPVRERTMTVVGTGGMLRLDESDGAVTLFRKTIDDGLQNVDHGTETLGEGVGEPLLDELREFIECARTGRRSIADGKSAVEVIRALELAKCDELAAV